MSNSKNNITDEKIIAYINDELSSDQRYDIENILSEDNEAFSRFAILNQSFTDIQRTDLEVTPDSLKERYNEVFNLNAVRSSQGSTFDDILEKFNDIIDRIIQPAPLVVTIVSACLIIFMLGILIEDEETINEPKNINEILNRIQKKQQRMKMTSKHRYSDGNSNNRFTPLTKPTKEKGIFVSFEKDKLIVKQKIKIVRNILIMNSDQSIIIKHRLKDTINSLSIDEFSKEDSIRVVIETIGTVVFDNWIKK